MWQVVPGVGEAWGSEGLGAGLWDRLGTGGLIPLTEEALGDPRAWASGGGERSGDQRAWGLASQGRSGDRRAWGLASGKAWGPEGLRSGGRGRPGDRRTWGVGVGQSLGIGGLGP